MLVSGTDGWRQADSLAFEFDKHDTVGQDLVAMSERHPGAGAEPLFSSITSPAASSMWIPLRMSSRELPRAANWRAAR